MTNKTVIENKVAELGLVLGSYDNDLERLSKKAINEVAESLFGDSTDIVVKVRGTYYVVECAVCDNECDFTLYTKHEYLDKYGDEYEYKFE